MLNQCHAANICSEKRCNTHFQLLLTTSWNEIHTVLNLLEIITIKNGCDHGFLPLITLRENWFLVLSDSK